MKLKVIEMDNNAHTSPWIVMKYRSK